MSLHLQIPYHCGGSTAFVGLIIWGLGSRVLGEGGGEGGGEGKYMSKKLNRERTSNTRGFQRKEFRSRHFQNSPTP